MSDLVVYGDVGSGVVSRRGTGLDGSGRDSSCSLSCGVRSDGNRGGRRLVSGGT